MLGKIRRFLVPKGEEIVGLLLSSTALVVITGLALFDVIVLSGNHWTAALFGLSVVSFGWLVSYIYNNNIPLFDED
ncbi:hypothetical protein LCGC14_2312550 [marine sediment metagenome]|uniref:Uncharacterized protein n=1 Tax=marine sediment metagenome TaxID=412755 RepID=A0A0F9EXK8_9ZZZZ